MARSSPFAHRSSQARSSRRSATLTTVPEAGAIIVSASFQTLVVTVQGPAFHKITVTDVIDRPIRSIRAYRVRNSDREHPVPLNSPVVSTRYGVTTSWKMGED